MSNPLPNAVALTTINDGDQAQGAPLRNNFSAIQTALNLLRACLAGGVAGQLLQAADGTDVQWATLGRLASGTKTASVTTAGTTFAGGADLLAAALSFTADGVSSYLVKVYSPAWNNSVAGTAELRLNLDGADGGRMAIYLCQAANANIQLDAATILVTPAAGVHTVNARLLTSTGTATVNAGAGGAGNLLPIFVSIEKV